MYASLFEINIFTYLEDPKEKLTTMNIYIHILLLRSIKRLGAT